MRIIALTAVLTASGLLGSMLTASAFAQEAPLGIASLDCTGDPETVTLANSGSETIDLVGWTLESHPIESQTYDLGIVGAMSPGEEVTVESGPAASGLLVWSKDPILQDAPSDFVRLVDDSGTVTHQVDCPPIESTSTPEATAMPEESSPEDVPHGGGPPGGSNRATPSAAVIALGGSGAFLVALSVLLIGVAIRIGSTTARMHSQPLGRSAGSINDTAPQYRRSAGPLSLIYVAGVVLAAVACLIFFRRR